SQGPKGAAKSFIINLDGSGLQELGEQGMPHWSPDDKQLAYHSSGGNGTKGGIYVQNADGKGRDWIAEGLSPRWSPDGSRIVFPAGKQVKVLDLADGVTRALTSETFDEPPLGFTWSPDGKRLAFVGRRNGESDLLIVEDGSAKSRLRDGKLRGPVSWSADG